MEDFRVALQRFLDTGTRTHEKMRKAIILDQQRDWKTHLEILGVHMKGHTGRAAPRVFEFRQRRGLAPFLLRYVSRYCLAKQCNQPEDRTLFRKEIVPSASISRLSHSCSYFFRLLVFHPPGLLTFESICIELP